MKIYKTENLKWLVVTLTGNAIAAFISETDAKMYFKKAIEKEEREFYKIVRK